MKKKYALFFFAIVLTAVIAYVSYFYLHPERVAFRQGEDYFVEKQIPQALAQYELANKLGHLHPKLYLRLADCYAELSDYHTALAWYETYLKERPADLIARYRYAQTLSTMGRGDAAIREYRKISERIDR